MSVVVYLLLCAVCNEQLVLIEFYSLTITLSSVSVVVPKPIARLHSLQG